MKRIAQTKPFAVDWPLWAILTVSFLMLFLFLNIKPPQYDEGVNAGVIEELTSQGYYSHDSVPGKGPLHFYLLFIFKIILGRNLWSLRLPAVLFTFAGIFLMMRLRTYLGKFTAYACALFIAVSPGMVFYSRYAIHESELFFFSILTLLGFFRFCSHKDKKSLWLIAAGLTGMAVAKETFILSTACFLISSFAVFRYEKSFPPLLKEACASQPLFRFRDLVKISLCCLFVCALLYSGFLLNWKKGAEIFPILGSWQRDEALQKDFFKPFFYWATLFLRYEWPSCAGFLLCFRLWTPAPRWARLLALYSLLIFFVYSLMPYKTPYSILQLIWPFLLITAGFLGRMAEQGGGRKKAAIILTLLFSLISTQKAITLNFFHYADASEPYVYQPTFKTVTEVAGKINSLIKKRPETKYMPVHVLMKNDWPLSWYLADFTKIHYSPEGYPVRADGVIVFCDADRHAALELKLKKSYFVQRLRLNPDQGETVVYFDREIFKDFFDAKTLVFEPVVLDPAKPEEGVTARYYTNAEWSGNPVKEEVAGTIDFSWDQDDRPLPASFGIVFEGEIHIPESGEITFYLASDDGSDFQIDDKVLINNLGPHTEKVMSARYYFKEGWYPIRIRFNDWGGAATIRFWWQLPSKAQEKIAPRYFRVSKRGNP